MALRGSQYRNRSAQHQNNGNTCKFVLSPSCVSLCPLVSLILSPLHRISHLCGAQHRIGDRKIGYHYWNTLRNQSPVKWILVRQLEVWESENQVTYFCWSSEGTGCQQTPFDQFDLPELREDLQNFVTPHQGTDRIIWKPPNASCLILMRCFQAALDKALPGF